MGGGVRNNAILCSQTLLPPALKGSTYSKGLVHVMDWHATFRDLAGAKDKAGKPTDGVNVWDAILKNHSSPRTEFLVNIDPCGGGRPGQPSCPGQEAAYRLQGCINGTCGDWKLLTGVAPDGWYAVPSTVPEERHEQRFPEEQVGAYIDKLFNISADPMEMHNIASKYPSVVAYLKMKISALAKEALAPCNVYGGSCFNNDPKAQAVLDSHKAWFPWATDPTPKSNGLVV